MENFNHGQCRVVTKPIYFVGELNGWSTDNSEYLFDTTDGLLYTLNLGKALTDGWKICDGTWDWNLGAPNEAASIGTPFNPVWKNDNNIALNTVGRARISYNVFTNELTVNSDIVAVWDNTINRWAQPYLHYSIDGGEHYSVVAMERAENETLEAATSMRRLPAIENLWQAEFPENTTHLTFSSDGVNPIDVTYTAAANKIIHNSLYDGEGNVTGVEEINADNMPVEYFDLRGRRVDNPANGIYIRRQGSKVTKVVR